MVFFSSDLYIYFVHVPCQNQYISVTVRTPTSQERTPPHLPGSCFIQDPGDEERTRLLSPSKSERPGVWRDGLAAGGRRL